jgi:hypothetical protein
MNERKPVPGTLSADLWLTGITKSFIGAPDAGLFQPDFPHLTWASVSKTRLKTYSTCRYR